ncbi:hypothetical protein S2M10_32920 [Sphingomonas sp. S2M10]|uniref:hypothetical protein n=1 Tax=Sphingomonas sp. S2M10 TaxID=2705010 RepID=UPI001457344B|nr:hypothetical protein [Sphingomonas sp. S2M10]NLS28282.1 hypothetical protein [Sphingomonas sp. S2M10]
MEMDELQSRLAVILDLEEQERPDWGEIERLSSELQRELPIDATPEAVHHYLDDADIRARDEPYATRQKKDVRRFIESGEFDDGTPIPWWGCALVLLLGAGLVKWLVG